MSLSLDGDTSTVHVFGSTVGDLLASQDIKVGEHDIVAPAADAPLNDGEKVVVRYGRLLTVTVDGKTADYWTTATTVDGALSELGIRADTRQAVGVPFPAAGPYRPGPDRHHAQGRHGHRRRRTKTRDSTGATVADALAAARGDPRRQDRVNPGPDDPAHRAAWRSPSTA